MQPLFKFPYTNTRFDKDAYKGGGIISQFFGEGQNYYKKVFDMIGHNGLDYAVIIGTELLSPTKLSIVDVVDKSWGYGLYIIAESDKYIFIFAHLSKVLVRKGDVVKPGQVIALTGNSGNSSGPHLHLDIRIKGSIDLENGYRGRTDPLPILESKDEMKIDYAKLSKLYTVIFHRPIDISGGDYAGKDLDFILDEFQKSDEWRAYDKLHKAAKVIEKDL